jgi:hypothetical protein
MMIARLAIETILMTSLKWSRETVTATEVRQSTRPRKEYIMTKLPNKEELVALIMANTDEFKKTHLMLKPVTEVRDIAAKYTTADEAPAEVVSAEIAHADDKPAPDTAEPIESPAPSVTRDEEEPTAKPQDETVPVETPKADKKSAKTEKTEKKAELSDKHKILIETVPLLPTFKNTKSVVTAKDLLAMVNDNHQIPPRKSGPIMTVLKRKGYFKLVGKNSGQKIVTVQLLTPAIEFLGLAKKAK